METSKAYDAWSVLYDTNVNKTRDLEGIAMRSMLADLYFTSVLELGCGTGKNTGWFAERADFVTAADFSIEMLEKARQKIDSPRVLFVQADVRQPWQFGNNTFDLVSCSLILEHVENLDPIFDQARNSLKRSGFFYIGELHPFKQYLGTKARFETAEGRLELECFVHHISDFMKAAVKHQFVCETITEWFDVGSELVKPPRIVGFLFRKV